MKIIIHHSGSTGNLYQAGDLLIEAGVPIRKIKESLNFKLSSIAGCLCSHSHGDHSKGVRDLLQCGIDCYCSEATANELNLGGHRLHIIEPGKQFTIGPWTIKAFDLVHDVQNIGFLIARGEDKIMYATDTNYIPVRFKGLTHIMLGINYDGEILVKNIVHGSLHPALGKRILTNHMSFSTFKKFLKANDLSQCREIHLLHLSQANSDEAKFKKETEQLTGVPTYIGK